MVGWHHWLNGHGFGWTLGVVDGQGSLAGCGSWGRNESDMTELLNWTELQVYNPFFSSFFFFFLRSFLMQIVSGLYWVFVCLFVWLVFTILHLFVLTWVSGHRVCGITSPYPGIEAATPALEGEFLSTRPSGKS